MRQKTFKLCVCSHRRRVHSKGQCEDCHSSCIFKEGNMPNIIPQKEGEASGGGSTRKQLFLVGS
jgi:hypothetical protein